MIPEKDQSEIMKCLGMLLGKVDSMERSQGRVTYALIGVIAAQIGVKVLGSDPLLDIATALGLFGCVLLLGCLISGLRIIMNGKRQVTKTGFWLTIMIGFIAVTQIAVYLRDISILDAKIIYIIRIIQNLSVVIFAWYLMHHAEIFMKSKKDG